MKFITAIIAGAISTVAGHCDWDLSKPFAHATNMNGTFSNRLVGGVRTLKPEGSDTAAGYFKLKNGVK